MNDTLVIRADATPNIGAGHVMRCLALAQAWVKSGRSVVLVGRITILWVQERLQKEGISVCYLKGDVPKEEDPDELLKQVKGYGATWLVVDGYHFTTECQKKLKAAEYKLLVIDDYNHLPEYYCDILLNQNVSAAGINYSGTVGAKFLGVEYVLLRQEVLNSIPVATVRERSEKIKNILLTLGGGDMSHGFESVRDFLSSDYLSGCVLRVVSGGVPTAKWKTLLADCPAQVEILEQVHDMPRQMLLADFCLTAGGSTCWELCVLGVPFAAVCVAENQQEVVRYLIEEGVCFGVDMLSKKFMSPSSWEFTKLKGVGSGAQVLVKYMAEEDICH